MVKTPGDLISRINDDIASDVANSSAEPVNFAISRHLCAVIFDPLMFAVDLEVSDDIRQGIVNTSQQQQQEQYMTDTVETTATPAPEDKKLKDALEKVAELTAQNEALTTENSSLKDQLASTQVEVRELKDALHAVYIPPNGVPDRYATTEGDINLLRLWSTRPSMIGSLAASISAVLREVFYHRFMRNQRVKLQQIADQDSVGSMVITNAGMSAIENAAVSEEHRASLDTLAKALEGFVKNTREANQTRNAIMAILEHLLIGHKAQG